MILVPGRRQNVGKAIPNRLPVHCLLLCGVAEAKAAGFPAKVGSRRSEAYSGAWLQPRTLLPPKYPASPSHGALGRWGLQATRRQSSLRALCTLRLLLKATSSLLISAQHDW